jgi:hypothetical protein
MESRDDGKGHRHGRIDMRPEIAPTANRHRDRNTQTTATCPRPDWTPVHGRMHNTHRKTE